MHGPSVIRNTHAPEHTHSLSPSFSHSLCLPHTPPPHPTPPLWTAFPYWTTQHSPLVASSHFISLSYRVFDENSQNFVSNLDFSQELQTHITNNHTSPLTYLSLKLNMPKTKLSISCPSNLFLFHPSNISVNGIITHQFSKSKPRSDSCFHFLHPMQ